METLSHVQLMERCGELEAQLHAMVAENAALKSSIDYIETKYMNWEGLSDAFAAAKALGTNITAAAIAALRAEVRAEVRAEGVEMFANHQQKKYDNLVSSGKILTDTGFSHYLYGEASTFAAQLRQSVQVKGVQS